LSAESHHDHGGGITDRAHGHHHRLSGEADSRYVLTALLLISGFMLAEVAVAVWAGSVALLADAGHMLTDAGALGLSYWAARVAVRPAGGVMTYGFKRAEILSAALNGLTLSVVAAGITVGAVERLLQPAKVNGLAVTVVAGVGVAVNLAATTVLARAGRQSLNIKAALAHLVTDIWAFAGTMIAGVVIITTGFRRADPIASLVVVALMVRASWSLLRASGRILLEAAPESFDLAELRAHILEIDEVASVHDLHAWVLTSDLPAVSAHVVIDDVCFADGTAPQVLDRLQSCLAGHFDVEHSTFQLEPAGHVDHEAHQHD
jgi:cobalt-zinc-cadmium efflux system protein